jgi:hypothetical protein
MPPLQKDDTLSNQLPHAKFRDTRINENVLNSGPPNIDSDSEFNRGSSMMHFNKPSHGRPNLKLHAQH